MRDLEFDIKGNNKTRPAFNQVKGDARDTNRELSLMAQSWNMAGNAAKLFAAGFTLTAVAGWGASVRGIMGDLADMVDLADKVGVGIEDLQRMTYGFGLAGVAAEDIDQILSQWSKRIGEAYTSGGKLAEVLEANNVPLTDAEGHLRSAVDLMRDYADLIANAGSEQERMTLATLAFGKAGGDMVNVLRDGADGMNELMDRTEEAGGVWDEELARRVADLDDAINDMWRGFQMDAQQAILGVIPYIDQVAAYAQKLNSALLASTTYGANPTPPAEVTKGGRVKTPLAERFDYGFGDIDVGNADANRALERELRSRYGRRTVIPGKGEGGFDNDNRSRGASTKAAREQESAYDRVIEKLKEEEAVLGLTDVARRIAIEQQRAGVEATSAEGMAISDLVANIERQKEAYEAATEAGDFMKDNLRESFADILPQIETGNKALDGFINRLAQAALDAAFFGEGPLSGLFGGGGGLLKSLFGGGRAIGGGVDPWHDYLVGENGPEIVRIGAKGGVVGGVSEGGGGGFVYSPNYSIDARGADQAAIAGLRRQLAEQNRTESKRVANIMRSQQVRGVRP